MKPNFVVDCSVAMAWCFLDEATPETKQLFKRTSDESVLVPALWFLEVTNTLVMAERKSRIGLNEVGHFISLINTFDLEVETHDPEVTFTHLLPLCRTHSLTSYDAVYLDLAIRRQLPLATLDESLRKAAKKAGVKLLGK